MSLRIKTHDDHIETVEIVSDAVDALTSATGARALIRSGAADVKDNARKVLDDARPILGAAMQQLLDIAANDCNGSDGKRNWRKSSAHMQVVMKIYRTLK